MIVSLTVRMSGLTVRIRVRGHSLCHSQGNAEESKNITELQNVFHDIVKMINLI